MITRSSRLLARAALTLALVGTVAATATADPFLAGTAAATRGDHAAAITAFESAIATRGWSSGALFDLGNAYAGAGQRGRAILAYERARVLAPRDSAIAANLARTREAAGIAAPPPTRLHALLAHLSADEWTKLAFASAILVALGVALAAWRPGRRGGLVMLALVGAVGALVAGAAATATALPPGAAIVVRADTARIAPLADADPTFTAAEGDEVLITNTHGDRVFVRAGDRAGWLPIASVESILTERSGSGA